MSHPDELLRTVFRAIHTAARGSTELDADRATAVLNALDDAGYRVVKQEPYGWSTPTGAMVAERPPYLGRRLWRDLP